MRLRFIERVDFRKNEQTNYVEWSKAHEELAKKLGPNDVLLFLNHGENQLVFVHGFDEMDGAKRPVKVLASRRLRMTGGKWNPLRLVAYAEQVGLAVEGLKRFEDYYKELKA